MLVKIYAENPSERELQRIAGALERGGLVVCPTDGRYAVACSLRAPRAIEQLRRMKGLDLPTIACADLSQVAEYVRVDNAAFRILRRNLPGPVAFVLPAGSQCPDKALERRRAIAVGIPAHAVTRAIVEALGAPLLTAQLQDEETEYTTDPELIHERLERSVAAVVDGGPGDPEPTAVVDLTGGEPEIVREGKGELQ